MAQVWGLDVEQVRGLAREMDVASGELQNIISKLTNLLGNTQWSGPDAERFRNEWQSTHAQSLLRAKGALEETASAARANAAAQESVSNQ